MIRIYHPYKNIMLYVTLKFLPRWKKYGFISLEPEFMIDSYKRVVH